MDTSTDSPDARLADPDKSLFNSAVKGLRGQIEQSDPRECISLCLNAISVISASHDLNVQARLQRTKVVIGLIPLQTDGYFVALASMAGQWHAAVRNEVIRILPAEYKHRSIAGQGAPSPERVAGVSVIESPSAPAPWIPAPTPEASTSSTPLLPSADATVILLGSEEDHETNRTLLQTHNFATHRAANFDSLPPLLEHDVCAIVVAASWWTTHPSSEHDRLFRSLIEYSSFIWFKIDVRHLGFPSSRAKEIIHDVRLAFPTTFDFVLGESARITQTEIADIRAVQALLSLVNSVRVVNSELDDAQTALLVAATTKSVRERSLRHDITLSRIRARFIPGGRTQAHLAFVEPDDGGVPIVVKIGAASDIYDEARRFKRFMAPHDTRLRPSIHRHFEWAAIVFGLVEDAGRGSPAPTLERRLQDVLFAEAHRDIAAARVDEAALEQLLERVVKRLVKLNSLPSGSSGFQSFASLSLRSITNMHANGINWSFSPDASGRSVNLHTIVPEIARQANRLDGIATVHGDIHLRNILCSDAEPHLIDYACSGPGHPCFDLARLESALMFQAIRMVSDERSLANIVAAISIDGEPTAEIARRYPEWTASIGNRLAFKISELVRTESLKLLSRHNGGLDDYLAVKAVVACQSLGILELQSGPIRSTLLALLPCFHSGRSDLPVLSTRANLSPVGHAADSTPATDSTT